MAKFITRINHFALYVKDLDIARKWFVDFLGLEICGKRQNELYLKAGTDVIKLTYDPERYHPFDHYGFSVESKIKMEELYKKMQSYGIKFIKDFHSRMGGYSMTFEDPCGHTGECQFFELVEYDYPFFK